MFMKYVFFSRWHMESEEFQYAHIFSMAKSVSKWPYWNKSLWCFLHPCLPSFKYLCTQQPDIGLISTHILWKLMKKWQQKRKINYASFCLWFLELRCDQYFWHQLRGLSIIPGRWSPNSCSIIDLPTAFSIPLTGLDVDPKREPKRMNKANDKYIDCPWYAICTSHTHADAENKKAGRAVITFYEHAISTVLCCPAWIHRIDEYMRCPKPDRPGFGSHRSYDHYLVYFS